MYLPSRDRRRSKHGGVREQKKTNPIYGISNEGVVVTNAHIETSLAIFEVIQSEVRMRREIVRSLIKTKSRIKISTTYTVL